MWTGLTAGRIDLCWSYGIGDLTADFRNRNKAILARDRGAGYWLWKPYVIADALKKAAQDDVIFYCDSGSFFIGPIAPLVRICREETPGVLGFVYDDEAERTWTKRDAFVLLGCDHKEFYDDKQIESGALVFCRNEFARNLVDQWLRFAQDPRTLTDDANQCGKPNLDGYREHRHDQSIFSLLCKKHGVMGRSHRLAFGPIVRDVRFDIAAGRDWLRPRPKLRWILRWSRPVSLNRWRRPQRQRRSNSHAETLSEL